MSPTLLFNTDKVRKFFNILGRLGREQSGTYKGYYKTGDGVPCQKEVFVNRTVNRYLRGKHLIWYRKSSTTGIYYNCYATIGKIEFALGWGNEIKVYFNDYSRPADLLSSIKLNPNEVFDLEGQWCDNDDLHKTMLKLSEVSIPEREFIFKAFDFNEYPKRRPKGMTDDDVKEKIRTTVSFKCMLLDGAYKLADKFRNDPANKGIMVGKLKEVL